jgi:hypothetical protein
VEVLRADPDTDTVRALRYLAGVEVFAGSAEADRLSAEALILGQALGVDTDELADLFRTRGIYLRDADRLPEAAAYYHQAARLATQSGDNQRLGWALLGLSDVALAAADPQPLLDRAATITSAKSPVQA